MTRYTIDFDPATQSLHLLLAEGSWTQGMSGSQLYRLIVDLEDDKLDLSANELKLFKGSDITALCAGRPIKKLPLVGASTHTKPTLADLGLEEELEL